MNNNIQNEINIYYYILNTNQNQNINNYIIDVLSSSNDLEVISNRIDHINLSSINVNALIKVYNTFYNIFNNFIKEVNVDNYYDIAKLFTLSNFYQKSNNISIILNNIKRKLANSQYIINDSVLPKFNFIRFKNKVKFKIIEYLSDVSSVYSILSINQKFTLSLPRNDILFNEESNIDNFILSNNNIRNNFKFLNFNNNKTTENFNYYLINTLADYSIEILNILNDWKDNINIDKYYKTYYDLYDDLFNFEDNSKYCKKIIDFFTIKTVMAHIHLAKYFDIDIENESEEEYSDYDTLNEMSDSSIRKDVIKSSVFNFIKLNILHQSLINLFAIAYYGREFKKLRFIDYETFFLMNGAQIYFYLLYYQIGLKSQIYHFSSKIPQIFIDNEFKTFKIEKDNENENENEIDYSFFNYNYFPQVDETEVLNGKMSNKKRNVFTYLPPLDIEFFESDEFLNSNIHYDQKMVNLNDLFNINKDIYVEYYTYYEIKSKDEVFKILMEIPLYKYIRQKIINKCEEINEDNYINEFVNDEFLRNLKLYINVVIFMIVFIEKSFYSNKIFYELENFSMIYRENLVEAKHSMILRCNESFGFNSINKSIKPIESESIYEIESFINQVKWRINGYFGMFVIFYLNGLCEERNYITFKNEANNNYYFNNNTLLNVMMIPIERLDNHFLTALMSFNNNNNRDNNRKDSEFFEYYKRVRANSRLFFTFQLSSLTRIELALNYISFNERMDQVYGNYLPIKLKQYNEELDDFCYKVQIFDSEFKNNINVNCFVWTIIITNKYNNIFNDKELFEINLKYGKGTITLKKIKEFSDEYKINLNIKKLHVILNELKIEKSNISIKTKDSLKEIDIGYIQYNNFHHFFPIVKTKISHYCCENLNILKSEYYKICAKGESIIQDKEIIIKKKLRYLKEEDITGWSTTFQLLKRLIKENLIKNLSSYEMEKYSYNMKEVEPNIEYIIKYPSSQTEIIEIDEEYNLKKTFIKNKLAVADTETYVDNDNIIPFCLCLIYLNEDEEIIKKSFYGEECQDEFLEYCYTNNIREIYFHNLKFDGWLFKNFQINDMIYHASRLYSLTLLYGTKSKKRIILKDSLALIPTKLKNFNKMFDLGEIEKELYPYNKINKMVILENELLIEECMNEFSNEDYNKFKEMLIKNKFIKNENKIDIEKLTIFYCLRDCEVLFYGLKKFEQMTMDLFDKINGLNFITISGLSYYIMKKNCFEGLRAYTGDIKSFIRKSIRGGRCMVKRNQKIKVNEEVVDFDACSLYPSAMNRLYLPTGELYGSNNEEEIKELFENKLMLENQIEPDNRYVSAMIIKCKIKRINKERDFPLLSYVKDGISYYNNNMEGKIVYLTHFELEDFIKYQEGSVKYIEAIYWIGAKDIRMSEYIKKCYNLRRDYKEEGNQLQEVLKLFMNSSYGKTIQKDIKEDYRFFDKVTGDTFIKNNYGRIKEVIKINPKSYWFKLDGISDLTYIPCHIGALILGMSKRIMNEVICTAEDNGIDVYYQDTDSIHIKKRDVKSLADAFEASFGRKLEGSGMGQFHVDFPLINNKVTWSKKSIFLGKKCYIDCLINTDGEEEDFIRMKGIPEKVIRNTAKDMNIELYELYDSMFKGEEIKFDLLNSNMPSFEYQKNFGIKLRNSFERILKFK